MMNTKRLCIGVMSLFVIFSLSGMEIERPSLMAAARLGNVRLFHKGTGFVVERDSKENNIQSCYISPILRNASRDRLSKFLAAYGYLRLNELKAQNGTVDYNLDACGRIKGGGPWLGAIVALGGTLATAAATVGAAVVAIPGGPVAMTAAACGTVTAGMALTAKATIAVSVSPTP